MPNWKLSVALAVVGLGLLAPSAARANSADALSRQTRFLGWSANEQVAAFRREVTARGPHGARDRYTLITLVEPARERVLASWRARAFSRTDARGHAVAITAAAFGADHPDFHDARPEAEWRTVEHKAHFRAWRYGFHDSTVRLRPAPETRLVVTDKAQSLRLVAETNQPVIFDAVVRLMNGDLVPLGHFTADAQPDMALRGVFRLYHSRSGKSLLAVSDTLDALGHPIKQQLHLVRLPVSPFAFNEVGATQSYHEIGLEVRELFGDLNPRAKALWDEHVGAFF